MFTVDAVRALRDRRTWGPLLLEQMRRLGVASVPIALDEARRSGFFEGMDGKLVVMCAFGAGLTWGSLGFRW